MYTPELNTLRDAAHNAAKAKGFHDQPREFGTALMLITSELGECLDADRKGKRTGPLDMAHLNCLDDETFKAAFENIVKDTVEDELADAQIRIMDTCGEHGIDIAAHVAAKMRYNSLRPTKHGKTY